jgi:hypothetical protein
MFMRKFLSNLGVTDEILVMGVVLALFVGVYFYQQYTHDHREIRDPEKEAEDSYRERRSAHEHAVYRSDSLFLGYAFDGLITGQEPVRRSAESTWLSMVKFTFSPAQIQPDPAGQPVDTYFDFSQPQACRLFVRYEKPVTRADSAGNDPSWLGQRIKKRAGEVFVTIGLDTLYLAGRSNLPEYKHEFPVKSPGPPSN